MEHEKTEVFYFSRLHRVFNPSPLDPKTHGNTWVSFSIGSYCSDNISTSIWTKLYLWSNIWRFLEILFAVLSPIRSDFFIDAIFFLLLYTYFNYSSTTKYYYSTYLRNWTKCKEELWSEFYVLFKLYYPLVLRLLWV